MRKTLCCLVGMITVMLGAAVFSQEITVRVPVGNTYPPFFIQDESGAWGGLAVELAERLLAEAGMTPVYMPLPFPRALAYLREGQLDMMLNLSITPERKEYIAFIGPQLDEIVVVVVRKETDFTLTSLDDFTHLPGPVGVERGKVYGKEFHEKRLHDNAFAGCLDEVTEVNLNEVKLEKGRLSAFLGYGYNTYYRIRTDPLYKNFKVHPFVVNTDWVYFGFSRKSVNSDTLSRLGRAYDQIVHKGEFEKIRQKYIIQ